MNDLRGGTIKKMIEVEMNQYLGYEKSAIPTMIIIIMAANKMAKQKLWFHRYRSFVASSILDYKLIK